MKLTLAITAAIALLSVATVTPGSADPAAKACLPDGSRVLAHSARALIATRHGAVFGCAYAKRRRFTLAEASGPFAVGGTFGAFGTASCDASCTKWVALVDLRRGPMEATDLAAEPDPAPACNKQSVCADSLRRVLVNNVGSMVWITCPARADDAGDDVSSCGESRMPVAVVRVDGRGQRVLDRGLRIRAASLRLSPSGRRVAWTSAGRSRSAALVGRATQG